MNMLRADDDEENENIDFNGEPVSSLRTSHRRPREGLSDNELDCVPFRLLHCQRSEHLLSLVCGSQRRRRDGLVDVEAHGVSSCPFGRQRGWDLVFQAILRFCHFATLILSSSVCNRLSS